MTATLNSERPPMPPGLSVLVVEDEPSARQASSRYLDYCGYRVATAASARQAFERAAQCKPDVLVCDWQLGHARDGVDVARELQHQYGASIVFVSAYPLDRLRYVTRDLDVTRYLRKPISLSVLAEVVGGIAQ